MAKSVAVMKVSHAERVGEVVVEPGDVRIGGPYGPSCQDRRRPPGDVKHPTDPCLQPVVQALWKQSYIRFPPLTYSLMSLGKNLVTSKCAACTVGSLLDFHR